MSDYWPIAFVILAAISAYRPLIIHWLATRPCPDLDYGDSRPCVAKCYECSPSVRLRIYDEQIDEDFE